MMFSYCCTPKSFCLILTLTLVKNCYSFLTSSACVTSNGYKVITHFNAFIVCIYQWETGRDKSNRTVSCNVHQIKYYLTTLHISVSSYAANWTFHVGFCVMRFIILAAGCFGFAYNRFIAVSDI
jgi:hypothetical protein